MGESKVMNMYKRGEDYYEGTNNLLIRNSKAVKMSNMDHKGLIAMGWEPCNPEDGDAYIAVWDWETEQWDKPKNIFEYVSRV